MVENLKVNHYRNGETISNMTNDTTWAGLSSGAYCNYDNNSSNAMTYGCLYNWLAVDDSRSLYYYNSGVNRVNYFDKQYGFSVRCVQD